MPPRRQRCAAPVRASHAGALGGTRAAAAACLGLFAALTATAQPAGRDGARSEDDALAAALELARTRLIVDTHIDVPYRLRNRRENVAEATETGDFDYPRARAGGLDVVFMSIYVPASYEDDGAFELADELIDSVERIAGEAPDRFRVVRSTSEARTAVDGGRIAFALGMENGAPIEGNLANLTHFANRGIRYITLAHSRSNHIADSSYDVVRRWGGLSPFGRRLVRAMNEAGVMIDVSHISDAALYDVLAESRVPVVATHSSARHFTPGWERNMSDEMIRALAAHGGVIQINFGSAFLTREANRWGARFASARNAAGIAHRLGSADGGSPADAAAADWSERFTAEYRAAHPYPYATVEDVVAHIDRVVRLAGIDHVGIGSDYDGVGPTLPIGLEDVSAYPNLVASLLAHGYTEDEVAKILGGNLMRVWRATERFAAAAR